MADDIYPGINNPESPADNWAPLTPHDSTNFTFVPKGICISSDTGGHFVAVGKDGGVATFYGSPGQVIPIRPRRINATGMTAGMTFTGLKA